MTEEEQKQLLAKREEMMNRFYTPAQIQKRLGISCKTLKKWREKDMMPMYTKRGGRIFYSAKALSDFLFVQRLLVSEHEGVLF